MNFYPENAIILAPLSGVSDYPFRRIARSFGCRYAFTEMIDAAALTYARARTEKMLFRGDDEEFLGVQLVGRNKEFLQTAASVLNEYDFDILDFNLGCPVPKVTKKGAGAALGREIKEAWDCFLILKRESKFPLSAKIRIIDENDVAPTLELVKGLQLLGAQAITIHGRVKEKYYSGPVAYDQIKNIAQQLEVQIVGNGGVFDGESYEAMRREAGVNTVMAARGAMGNPWLFDDFRKPQKSEVLAVCREHVLQMVEFYGETIGMKLARSVIHGYLKGRSFRGEWRNQASFVADLAGFEKFLSEAE